MGVPGLWEILRPAAQQRSIVHLSVEEGFLSNKHDKRGYRIGIDAYIWFFHAHSSREGENPELRMLFFRLARFLAMPILPVFVFDGPAKPRWKRNKQVGGRQHALLGSFKEMIKAFGFEWHQAPGEAEAELAYLNRIEIIDAVLSDDVDNFLFGATMVMRNPSATLTGNKGVAMKNADGRTDDKHVRLFSSKALKNHPNIQLTHGGFILIGLMSGGDYDTGGLQNAGIKISHALARGGLGDSLVDLYRTHRHNPQVLSDALVQWRAEVRRYLSTDPDGYIGSRRRALAQSFPETFPPLTVLQDYVMPQTSELRGHVPTFEWAKQPDLSAISKCCEMHYEWGVKPLILKRFRTVIWQGALMRVLRASVMKGDERERRKAGNAIMQTPRKGRRDADMAFGTPSKFVAQCLSRMELATPGAEPIYEDDKPLLVKIHSSRTHASTDGILEYRVEIAPVQFVRIVETGFLGLRPPDSIDVEAFGRRRALMDDEGGFEGDDDEEGGGKGKKKKEVHPHDHLRLWVPADMLEMAEPRLVQEYENVGLEKERKKEEKERRARERAEGKSPKKTAAKPTTPRKTKATKTAEDVFGFLDDMAPSQELRLPKKTGPPKKFVTEDSSDEDVGPTPRPASKAPFKDPTSTDLLARLTSGERYGDGDVSETDYMSTGSITERRRGKTTETRPLELPVVPTTSFTAKKSTLLAALESPTKSKSKAKKPTRLKITTSQAAQSSSSAQPSSSDNARKFLFTMPSDYVEDLDVDEEDLDPYAVLTGEVDTSGSSRASSGSRLGNSNAAARVVEKPKAPKTKAKAKSRAINEPMEDFSDLFSPVSSPVVTQDVPIFQPFRSTSGLGKRNKFITDDDSSDHSPLPKSPKKSKAQVSPKKTAPETTPRSSRGMSRTTSKPQQSATSSQQPSSSVGLSSMPPSLIDLLADVPVLGVKKKTVPAKQKAVEKLDVIDLSSSSDEDVLATRPSQPTRVAASRSTKIAASGAARSQGSSRRPIPSASSRSTLEVIDLD